MLNISELFSRHYQWFFSGLGVPLVIGLATLIWRLRLRTGSARENHPHLSVHTQNIDLSARDYHENYDHALGIFIANTGNSPIHISRALFRNEVRVLGILRKKSELPVYPKAFKDAETDAYELKFGDQWYDPQTDIPPRKRVMTYLPLSRPAPDDSTNTRRHGQIILRYSSDEKIGTHTVYV